jgi:hypothetical protein
MSSVYVLTNPSIPGQIKVGMTKGDPKKRARELHSTGVPTPFELAAVWKVPEGDERKYEREAHNALKAFRVSRAREFFQVELSDALLILNKIIPTIEQIKAKEERKAARLKKQAQLQTEEAERGQKQALADKIDSLRIKQQRKREDVTNTKSEIAYYRKVLGQPEDLMLVAGKAISVGISKMTEYVIEKLVVVFWFVIPTIIALYVFITSDAEGGEVFFLVLKYFGYSYAGLLLLFLSLSTFNIVYVVLSNIWKLITPEKRPRKEPEVKITLSNRVTHKEARELIVFKTLLIKEKERELKALSDELLSLLSTQ